MSIIIDGAFILYLNIFLVINFYCILPKYQSAMDGNIF